jgi:vacuolar-type H+-ATPase subunit I/STV1
MSENHLPAIPEIAFASPQLLLSEILEKLTALEERETAREEKLAALEEENRALREEIASLREDSALERAHDRKRITDLEKLAETEARDAALARQRISKLEAPAPTLREETAAAHLDSLFSEMKRLRMRQTTTKDAARLLGVSKPLIDKIKPYLAADPRFVILRDPHHKQRHLIRLAGT